MTIRIRKVVTAIDAEGRTFSEVHSEQQVGERWFPLDPVSLAEVGAEAKAWQDLYGATQAAEISSLTAERDKVRADVEAATNALTEAEIARDAALAQVASLQPIADSVAGLQAEIDRLTALVPPPIGPRQIYPRELLGRLTFAEVVAAIRTDDEQAIFAVANLQTCVDPVDLDLDETRQLIGALVVAGILTPERMAEVLS